MNIQKLILYLLILLFVTSFVSTLVISVFLATGTYELSTPAIGHAEKDHEKPILGQFGPISTVVLILGIPLLILITTAAYAFYISIPGNKMYTKNPLKF
tara:strand:+ start:359 stop:655 length:297 start_codon:yes stop_codon:yes gene_type:complete